MAYKRTSKKTGNTTRTTTTKSSKGTRITNSTKASTGRLSKTYSRSTGPNGQIRQTWTDNNNGWITRRTKVFGGSKRKRSTSRRSRKTKGNDLLFRIIIWMIFLPFKIVWWLLKKIFGR